jgi:hypothetical protein
MPAIPAYLAALTAFVDHDALVDEMVGGLSPDLAERISDWRSAKVLDLHRTRGFSPRTTDRAIDPHSWPLGQESAAMIEATLAAWHRLLCAMDVAWDGLPECDRDRVTPPPD